MPLSMSLSDWVASNRTGRVGHMLARAGAFLGFAGGAGAALYAPANDQVPFVLVAILAITPGIIVVTVGLLLLARNGTYRGSGSVRWWNWLTWHL